ncbi:acyltransferase [Fibrella forsythiae]|uniref:Acyltransferase n=1 Tax=Fibrella forsythiae TaxID=2817061 RepID=A0ABS3JI09_9BACT|nr:acyltransferase [Fibrella forsythiae]MBO0949645.1 acyltransferase [Fibrella forsythiae]
MKTLLERIVQLRNPRFRFSPALANGLILAFGWQQVRALVRSSGLLLRGRLPKGMVRGRGVQFFNLRQIQWGRFLKLGDHVYCSAIATDGIRLGNQVSIGAFSRLVVSTTLDNPGLYIRIGDRVGIGEFAYLGGAGGLTIGDDCIVGQYFSCHPENHLFGDLNVPIRLQGVERKPIIIGINCWIGSKVTVLGGVTIGDGCVVAAGAVVTQSFPANSLIGGVPAKLLRTRAEATKTRQASLSLACSE